MKDLVSIIDKKKKRLGQGHGSGRSKTAGRGTKGQKARGKIALSFEGGALPLVKRMPFLKGKGRNKSLQEKPLLLTLGDLNKLPKNTKVDYETLVKYNLIKSKKRSMSTVKIVATGEITTPLIVNISTTRSAALKIEQAGGKVGKAS